MSYVLIYGKDDVIYQDLWLCATLRYLYLIPYYPLKFELSILLILSTLVQVSAQMIYAIYQKVQFYTCGFVTISERVVCRSNWTGG